MQRRKRDHQKKTLYTSAYNVPMSTASPADDLGKLILRITVAGLLLFHGIHKLFHGIGGIEAQLAAHDWPSLLAYGVYVGEVLAPLALLVGWKSRAAAAIVAINMIVAVALMHADQLFALGPKGSWAVELPMFYLLASIAIVMLGGGRYAVARGGRLD